MLEKYIRLLFINSILQYGSGQKAAAVFLPGFAINWKQNQVTRQPQFRDLTHIIYTMESKRDSMGHLGTHLVSVGLKGAKIDSFWVAIFCSG